LANWELYSGAGIFWLGCLVGAKPLRPDWVPVKRRLPDWGLAGWKPALQRLARELGEPQRELAVWPILLVPVPDYLAELRD